MPQKLQLKLLSNSGELLNMVTCHAGRVSVLRSSVPSELRPYQRVLSGTPGKENIVAACDGSEYKADEHTVMGFGEPSPTAGLSVREFLARWEVPDSAVDSLLLSIGLENTATKNCSELSADQTARLRLVAATTDPDKILVLNDPFEHISGQWRERAAELLATFARARKVIVVIPSLSYRPECWIDNQIVERIEVGQTSHRTIGFGSAGSVHNAMINELRDKLRQEPPPPTAPPREPTRAAATLSVAALGGSSGPHLVTDEPPVSMPTRASSFLKLGSFVAAAGMGVWVAITVAPKLSLMVPQWTANRSSLEQPKNQAGPQPNNQAQNIRGLPSEDTKALEPQQLSQSKLLAASPQMNKQNSPPLAGDYVLDHYPEAIRTSVLNTAQGITNYQPAPHSQPAVAVAPTSKSAPSGNLFSLLEQAGRGDAGNSANNPPEAAWQPGPEQSTEEEIDDTEPTEMSPEEERREAIRNRFLEAIRAAAERRQQEDSGE